MQLIRGREVFMAYAIEVILLLLGIITYAAIETHLKLRRDEQQIAVAKRAALTDLLPTPKDLLTRLLKQRLAT
jgi:hypothetical protein